MLLILSFPLSLKIFQGSVYYTTLPPSGCCHVFPPSPQPPPSAQLWPNFFSLSLPFINPLVYCANSCCLISLKIDVSFCGSGKNFLLLPSPLLCSEGWKFCCSIIFPQEVWRAESFSSLLAWRRAPKCMLSHRKGKNWRFRAFS